MHIFIIGNGGHANVVAEGAELLGYQVSYIVKDQGTREDSITEEDFLRKFDPQDSSYGMICGVGSIGSTALRNAILNKFFDYDPRFINIVHPRAIVSSTTAIGRGVFIAPGAIISSRTKIGNHTIVNTGAIVDHDSEIESGCHIGPGATLSGNVTLKEAVHVGAGATIIQGILVAERTIIGAGSVVIKDIPIPDATWAGVPCKMLRQAR